ncbi:hypothetical protein AGMMS50212_10100 [Spirochaetia bacterium]|nr:hypothetical protein AGMMS50212_10100 [Spirochaetia bacterium]
MYKKIPEILSLLICKIVKPPFTYRGIKITEELLCTTLEILNAEETKALPQNARNLSAEDTPDGLDKRIKIKLCGNTRVANIVSDILAEKEIIEIIRQTNQTIHINRCSRFVIFIFKSKIKFFPFISYLKIIT